MKDIKTGDKVSEVFLAAEKNLAYSQKGSPYLNLRLRDRTGEVDGKVWENALAWDKAFKRGDLIRIQARALNFKNAIQLSIIELKKVEDGEVELADYFPVAKGDPAEHVRRDSRSMCEQDQDPLPGRTSPGIFRGRANRRALQDGRRRPRGFITSTSAVFWNTPFRSSASSIGRRTIIRGSTGIS